jgi:hypothetical protein
METKRTDFDNIRQDVNKVKTYANDLQIFIGVNEMTNVVDGEVKKQKGAINYDLFELKLDFPSELESFMTSLPSGNMSQPAIRTRPLSLVWKLTVVFLVSCGVTPSLLSCRICACNSAFLTRLVLHCYGKLVIAVQKGKRLLMFSNNGNYEKDIVRFSGIPFEVSYTGENIVAVTIYNKQEVVFVTCRICACNSAFLTRLVLHCFFVTDTTPNLETSFIKDSNSDGKSSFSSKRS